MGEEVVSLALPWPPSVNTIWRKFQGRMVLSQAGRDYRDAVRGVVLSTILWPRVRLSGRLAVDLKLHPPDARRRDVDNVLKALLDALTHAGVWSDDSQVKRLSVEMCDEFRIQGGRVFARIFPALRNSGP